jgi:hypothetical protein
MGSAGGGLKGALDFHLKFSTYAAAFGVRDAIPYVGTGRVPVESLCVGYAGFNRGRDRTVAGNAGGIEVIEEDYHDALDAPGIGAHAK